MFFSFHWVHIGIHTNIMWRNFVALWLFVLAFGNIQYAIYNFFYKVEETSVDLSACIGLRITVSGTIAFSSEDP